MCEKGERFMEWMRDGGEIKLTLVTLVILRDDYPIEKSKKLLLFSMNV